MKILKNINFLDRLKNNSKNKSNDLNRNLTNKEINNKYYYNFPLHIESIEKLNNQYVIKVINVKKQKVEEIIILYDDKQYTFYPNTSDNYITLNLELIEFSNIYQKPQIYSCKIAGMNYLFNEDDKNFSIITKAKSIYFLGKEKVLYQNKMADLIGKKPNDIKYLAQNYGLYWNCVCGKSNLNGLEECPICHNKKENLFSKSISVSEEAKETELINKIYVNVSIWVFLILFVNFMYQGFYGDFFFDYENKNSFFDFFNRFIVPFVLLFSTIGLVLARNKYNKVVYNISEAIKVLSLVYLNIVSALFTVLTAYNFFILLLFDVVFVITFVYKQIHSMNKLYHYVGVILSLVAFIIGLVQIKQYSQYDMVIQKEGIYLKVETDDINYTIPDYINRIPVKSVYFNNDLVYQIKELKISKNLENLFITSTLTLPKLETIVVDQDNLKFEVRNNLLYHKDGTIFLVPITTKEITINDEVIPNNALKDVVNLETLVIGENVKTIGNNAFANCSLLSSVTFSTSGNLESIGEYAFKNCLSMKQIDFPISIQKMGIGVLENTSSLEYLRVPFIGEKRENHDDLTNNTGIFTFIFGSRTYSLSEVIPQTLKTVIIYDIDRIHNVTFYEEQYIESITLPEEMLYFGKSNFYGCKSLNNFIIPNGIETINESTFEGCTSLSNITIPASVKTIKANAFLNTNLVNVIYLGDVSILEIDPIGNQKLIEILNLNKG